MEPARPSARREWSAVALMAVCLSLSTGCALFRRPTTPVASPAPATPPQRSPSALRLQRADALLAGDRIEEAASELHSLVEDHPSSAEAPQALFQLAVVYLAPDSPLHDGAQGISLLRDLVDSYPSSSWSLASETILRLARTNASLRDVAAQLQEQLDELKRIDIGSDG